MKSDNINKREKHLMYHGAPNIYSHNFRKI